MTNGGRTGKLISILDVETRDLGVTQAEDVADLLSLSPCRNGLEVTGIARVGRSAPRQVLTTAEPWGWGATLSKTVVDG